MLEEETEIKIDSAGAKLKECRERSNLGITDMASRMHLDVKVIRAIEEDDYDVLPDPIYIRGYIRSYCKLLGQNPDEILELFKKNGNREDPEIIPEIKYPAQTSSSDKPVKAFTYLISLGLVLLVIAWWQSNFVIKAPPPRVVNTAPALTTPPATRMPEQVLEEISIDEVNKVSPLTIEYPGDISIKPDEEEEDPGIILKQPEEDDFSSGPATEEGASTGSGPVNPAFERAMTGIAGSRSNSGQAILSLPASRPDTPEDLQSPPSTGPDTLVLRLTADSWIEIFDVNDQKVYFDLGRTGDRLTLNGTAPFDILLGFAQGVRIEFNGKPVDQSPYTRAGVARFSLDE